jgi:hypothetical protein
LRRFELDAASIARHAEWDWYPRWIPTYHKLTREMHHLAEMRGLDFQEIHRTAVAELLAVYDAARAREQRRRTA